MKCIIIEDEPAAQSILEQNILHYPGLINCGTFGNVFDARTWLDTNSTHLIFLDINLPEMSGVSFVKSLLHPPLIIFTTAYPQYAIDGFDLEIVDFLLKPFSFERFCKAVDKAKEKLILNGSKIIPQDTITLKSDKKLYQININDIIFIESCGDYITLMLENKKLIVHGTLKNWEEKLTRLGFMKVHRTAIVNLSKIDHLDGNQIYICEHKLPVSELFKEKLLERMFGKGLD